jgi:hypothetical protein
MDWEGFARMFFTVPLLIGVFVFLTGLLVLMTPRRSWSATIYGLVLVVVGGLVAWGMWTSVMGA